MTQHKFASWWGDTLLVGIADPDRATRFVRVKSAQCRPTIAQNVAQLLVCFVSPVALRHRNKDPAPFWHPVDVFLSFCPIVWQYFARHCRQLRSPYFYAPITWVNSISLLKTYALSYILPKANNNYNL
jgi:hypothetical protein